MAPSMLPVLPYILRYLAPSLPHTFYALSKDDYMEIRGSYRSLTSCALVCSSWCWTAQVALFRSVMLARPSRFELDRGSLTVYGGGAPNATSFLRTLRDRRALGPVVRSLHLFCRKGISETIRDILASCPNVSVLVLASSPEDVLSDPLSGFGQYSSVRVFGHRHYTPDDNILSSLGRCFPGVVELQLPTVHLAADALSTGIFRDLRYLHIHSAGAELENLAALDIRVLRIHHLRGFRHTILPFRRTLRILDVWKLTEPIYQEKEDTMDGLEDFFELRVLKVYHDQYPLFPHTLPPKLETLAINFEVLDIHPERVRHAVEHHTSVRRVVVLHDGHNILLASAKAEKVLGGLSLNYRLVADDNVWT